jgi:hypothetical protein
MARLIAAICFLLLAAFPIAQAGGGGGELSPTVVATYEVHGRMLDLLVLWRGKAGWLATRPTQGGSNQSLFSAGGSARTHSVVVHGRSLELRVDTKTNTAHIQEQVIPLQGVNVLLIDDVESPAVRVAGTLWVDPQLQDGLVGDPISALVKQSPILADYLKH